MAKSKWTVLVGVFLQDPSLTPFPFYLRVYILASLMNKPVALRQDAQSMQGSTYHVKLKAVMFLHQTQHKHTETCNNRTTY